MKEKLTSLNVLILFRKIIPVILILCFSYLQRSNAQVFWTENFGTGCNQGQLAINAASANGSWTVTASGTNDAFANEWYVSATENGFPPGTCRNSCLLDGTLSNQTLHAGNVAGSPNSSVLCLNGDCGAVYDPGGFVPNQVTTHKRIESPVIDCSGKNNITLSFNYFENGDGPSDNATVWYYSGSSWVQLVDPPKTDLVNCSGEGYWTVYNVLLPPSANNNSNIRIGFQWVNNDDATGVSPSFAVDDITLNTPPPILIAGFSQNDSSGCDTVCIDFFDLSTSTPDTANEWHWYFPGGTPDSSQLRNPANICYDSVGSFEVTLIVGNGISYDTLTKDSAVIITGPCDSITGIAGIPAFQLTLRVYPNPSATGIFHFQLNDVNEQINNLEITDIMGRIIYAVKKNKFEINISENANGVYFYSVKTKSNKLFKGKLIK